MKRIITVSAVGLMALALMSCGQKAPKVSAIVDGPEPSALLLEYDVPVLAESVNAQAFAVAGREVRGAFVTDENPFDKDAHRGPGHWMAGKKDGKYVIVLLRGGDRPEGQPGDKPAGEQCDKCKGEAPAECCEKPEAEQCDKCKDEAPAECCEKPEAEKCDSCKHEEMHHEGKPGMKPEGKPGKRDHGPKPADKPEITVPDISVQQVSDIKTTDGKTLKAWKKVVKATEAIPFMGMRPGHNHGEPAGRGPAPKPGKQPGPKPE